MKGLLFLTGILYISMPRAASANEAHNVFNKLFNLFSGETLVSKFEIRKRSGFLPKLKRARTRITRMSVLCMW